MFFFCSFPIFFFSRVFLDLFVLFFLVSLGWIFCSMGFSCFFSLVFLGFFRVVWVFSMDFCFCFFLIPRFSVLFAVFLGFVCSVFRFFSFLGCLTVVLGFF